MTGPNGTDRDPATNGHHAIAAMIDLQLWDMRLSAVLNTIAMAMEHAKQRDWTQDHSRQVREMMSIADSIASGDGPANVPAGFGPIVRTAHAKALVKIAAGIGAPQPTMPHVADAPGFAGGAANGDAAGAEGGG